MAPNAEMEDKASEAALRAFISEGELDVTEHVPRILISAAESFIRSLVNNSDPQEMTPEDVAQSINDIPEYSFLRHAVTEIVGN